MPNTHEKLLHAVRNGIIIRNAQILEKAGITADNDSNKNDDIQPIPLKSVQQVLREAARLKGN
jgi:hypothetical protein